jgi:hypothetical protein
MSSALRDGDFHRFNAMQERNEALESINKRLARQLGASACEED